MNVCSDANTRALAAFGRWEERWGSGKYIYFPTAMEERKDVTERRRIKSLGRVIRLGRNSTPGRTSLYRIISLIVLSKCRAQKWTGTNWEEKKLLDESADERVNSRKRERVFFILGEEFQFGV